MRRSCTLHGLPPEDPPSKEGREGETMDQPVTVDPHIEGIPVIVYVGKYSSFENPSTPTLVVVQQPSSHESSLQFHTEGYFGS